MPEVAYETIIQRPREAVWEFVKDMNNWAPFLTGYQRHEIVSDTDSIWTLKGDVGVLSRTVRLEAHVTEWNGPERVSFTLRGLDEPVEGGGTLVMTEHVGVSATEAVTPAPGLLGRMLGAFSRWLFRLMHGSGAERALRSSSSTEAARLTFTLRMDAGGPMAPLVNAMLAPALLPAAEDLATKIASHLERRRPAG